MHRTRFRDSVVTVNTEGECCLIASYRQCWMRNAVLQAAHGLGAVMSHDIFICYSARDKTVANAICAVLEAEGVRCWIAPRDIMPGADWGESIIDAINEAHGMVLIFSS